MMQTGMIELTVNDIKQYCYCKRIIFFNHNMPVERKSTYKMIHGQLSEEMIKKLENRRKFNKYNLEKGERIFNLWMTSKKLCLAGKLDLLIKSPAGYYPVDFKYTNGFPQSNHLYQLAGYALLIEDNFRAQVDCGFIYLVPQDKVIMLSLTEKIKNETVKILDDIRELIKKEKMPEVNLTRAKCQDCEFRNYCGDIF